METRIIDDDPDIAEAVALCFEIRWPNTEVLMACDGQTGLRIFQEHGLDLVALDPGLRDMDGVDVCKRLRAGSDVVIVVLTVRDGRTDVIRGLELGDDNYMTKPFDQMELLARARSALCRGKREEKSAANFANGRLSIDYNGREVRMNRELVRLTPPQYNLLQHLAQQRVAS